MKEMMSTGIYLLVVLILTYLVITFVGQRTEVSGESMESTLEDGDNLIVDKISYRLGEPKRYDIIVFPFRYDPGTFYIKRIIGLPGETVRIDREGKIYINDQILNEAYGREIIKESMIGIAEMPMGDNRNHSADSRTAEVGNIKKSDMIGKVWIRIWPLSKFGKVN